MPLRRLVREKPFLIAAFSIFLCLTILFGLKTAFLVTGANRHDPAEIAPWMTVRHIARVRDVSPALIIEVLDLEPDRRDARPLGRIARDRRVDVHTLIAAIERATANPDDAQGQGDAQEPTSGDQRP